MVIHGEPAGVSCHSPHTCFSCEVACIHIAYHSGCGGADQRKVDADAALGAGVDILIPAEFLAVILRAYVVFTSCYMLVNHIVVFVCVVCVLITCYGIALPVEGLYQIIPELVVEAPLPVHQLCQPETVGVCRLCPLHPFLSVILQHRILSHPHIEIYLPPVPYLPAPEIISGGVFGEIQVVELNVVSVPQVREVSALRGLQRRDEIRLVGSQVEVVVIACVVVHHRYLLVYACP